MRIGKWFLLTLLAGGCLSPVQEVAQAPFITNEDVRNAVTRADAYASGRFDKVTDTLKKIDDQNAIQTNLNSQLGLSVGKLGEEVSAVKLNVDSLAKVNLDARLTAVANTQAELRAQLNANMEATANLDTKLSATVTAVAKLDAKLDAMVTAQVGVGNEVRSLKQDLTAGHDVNQTQFTEEMLAALQSANHTATWASAIYAAVIVALVVCATVAISLILHRSRQRAEKRADEYKDRFMKSMLGPRGL